MYLGFLSLAAGANTEIRRSAIAKSFRTPRPRRANPQEVGPANRVPGVPLDLTPASGRMRSMRNLFRRARANRL